MPEAIRVVPPSRWRKALPIAVTFLLATATAALILSAYLAWKDARANEAERARVVLVQARHDAEIERLLDTMNRRALEAFRAQKAMHRCMLQLQADLARQAGLVPPRLPGRTMRACRAFSADTPHEVVRVVQEPPARRTGGDRPKHEPCEKAGRSGRCRPTRR